jgi:hypothetical protein
MEYMVILILTGRTSDLHLITINHRNYFFI